MCALWHFPRHARVSIPGIFILERTNAAAEKNGAEVEHQATALPSVDRVAREQIVGGISQGIPRSGYWAGRMQLPEERGWVEHYAATLPSIDVVAHE